jgi:two-component system sensor histidine kinase PilS (NtrC family)
MPASARLAQARLKDPATEAPIASGVPRARWYNRKLQKSFNKAMDQASSQASEYREHVTGGGPAYPLSPDLTLRVIKYLNAFRIVIALALIVASAYDLMLISQARDNPTLTLTALVSYLVIGIGLAVVTHRESLGCYPLAQLSLMVDILFLSLAYVLFGGLASGLGVLLIFISASAAILLPLRLALFIASLATIVIVGEAMILSVAGAGYGENLISAGFYGTTNLLTAVLVHLLAFWARDYRLIAEHQQRRLTRLEQINELIIRRMRGGVLAVDQNGVIQMMNESAWFLLGSPSSSDRVLEQVSPELSDALGNWRKRPGGDSMPLTLKASQAQVVPKFVTLPGQHDIRVLIFLEDNDVVAQRALELSNSSLAKLSGSIAHEIRNPLAAANHAAQLLAESESLDDADQRLISIITKQSRRMNDIVENILQLARREKSRPDLLELGPWLEDVTSEFEIAHTGQNLKIQRDLPEGETLVMFDRSQLHQVIWKLLENAVDHGAEENASLDIALRMVRDDRSGYCVVSVENGGPGIPEQHIEHIFEPFYTTRQQGSGLGLYVARQLCEANQAEITVDSTPGWKTRFHIRLALTASIEAELQPMEDASNS